MERRLINQFLMYPDYSAGSLMTIEFVDLKKEMTVKEALERVRKMHLTKKPFTLAMLQMHKGV